MRVVLTVASFSLSYGGPAVSVPRLAAALSQRGVDVSLWAPDGSASCAQLGPGNAHVNLAGESFAHLLKTFQPQIVHDNGIWLNHNRVIARLCRGHDIARVVSPRGMLEPWALRYKRVRKLVAWHLYQRRDLESAAMLLGTAAEEAENIGRLLGAPVAQIPNGVDLPLATVEARQRPHPRADRVALFLSRVHPKKGLPMLLEAWARLRPKGWRLVVAGPQEENHGQEIAALVRRLLLHEVVDLVGPKFGADKEELYRSAELFILPTYSENFGMVIAEALSYGVPVLTTTGTPWSALENVGCGWWVAPTSQSIEQSLSIALALSPDALNEMGRRGRDLVQREYSWAGVATAVHDLYSRVLSQAASLKKEP